MTHSVFQLRSLLAAHNCAGTENTFNTKVSFIMFKGSRIVETINQRNIINLTRIGSSGLYLNIPIFHSTHIHMNTHTLIAYKRITTIALLLSIHSIDHQSTELFVRQFVFHVQLFILKSGLFIMNEGYFACCGTI